MRCKAVEPLLSEYIDNRLSARRTLELERHISECHSCSRVYNELRRTVVLVASAPRASVSDDFMSSLQARLETREPSPARAAWVENIRALFRPRALPAWGAAAAAAALAAFLLMPGGKDNVPSPEGAFASPNAAAVAASHQNVVISASDPFADLAAVNLAAHVTEDSGADSESAL